MNIEYVDAYGFIVDKVFWTMGLKTMPTSKNSNIVSFHMP